MLRRRLSGLFHRYRLAHAAVPGRCGPIRDASGRVIGRIDRLVLGPERLQVSGWIAPGALAAGSRIRLCAFGQEIAAGAPAGHPVQPPGGAGHAAGDAGSHAGGPALPAGADRPDPGPGPAGRFDLVLPRPAVPVPDPDPAAVAAGHPPPELRPGDAPPLRLRFAAAPRVWLGQLGGFSLALLRLLPVLVQWRLTHDPRHRATVKRLLGLDLHNDFGPLSPGMPGPGMLEGLRRPAPAGTAEPGRRTGQDPWEAPRQGALALPDGPVSDLPPSGLPLSDLPPSGPAGAAPPPDLPAPDLLIPVLLIPVHNAHDLLTDCLDRVHRHTHGRWEAVLVEDGSTDPRIRPLVRGWVRARQAEGRRVRLVEHDSARGFIGAVNAGIASLTRAAASAVGAAGAAGPDQRQPPGQEARQDAGQQAPGQMPGSGTAGPPVYAHWNGPGHPHGAEHPAALPLTAALEGRALVLLNTDALLPEGWNTRLLAPLADPGVASVTPMSNDAEITSVPVICRRSDLPPGAGDALDLVARRFDPRRTVAPMPTGVGFCMAIAPRFLDLVPGLDPAFGRGYGEEVDWCQRIRALGGRHLGTGALFVEHRGGTSFGSAEKRALIARNGALISARYPAYDGEVQEFITKDPLRAPRLALALALAGLQAEWAGPQAAPAGPAQGTAPAGDAGRGQDRELAGRTAPEAPAEVPAASQGADLANTPGREGAPRGADKDAVPPVLPVPLPVPVYLAHALGGGAEIWLGRQIAADLARGLSPAVLRVGTLGGRWQLELHAATGVTGGFTADFGQIRLLLDLLPRRRLVYSCGVGDPDPAQLPGLLAGLRRPQDRLEVLFHDWFPISPAYTLLDQDGVWRGPVGPDRPDPAHIARRPSGETVALADWQAAWGGLVRAADAVVLFSEDGRRQIAAAWPDLDPARIHIRPHALPEATLLALAGPGRDAAQTAGRAGEQTGTGAGAPARTGEARAGEARATTGTGISHRAGAATGSGTGLRAGPETGSESGTETGPETGPSIGSETGLGAGTAGATPPAPSPPAPSPAAGATPPPLRAGAPAAPTTAPTTALRASCGQAPVLGIIGSLNRHKGAAVVAELARAGRAAGLGGVVVLGQSDPALALPRQLKVHGGYRIAEIPALIRRYGITHWLVPAIWPETFSYATHEALATGLPVLAFDLGAQGMAVRAAPNGRVLAFSPGAPEDMGRVLAEAVLAALALPAERIPHAAG